MWRPIQSTSAGVAEWLRPNSISNGKIEPSPACQPRYPYRDRTISPSRDATLRFAVFWLRLRYSPHSNERFLGQFVRSACLARIEDPFQQLPSHLSHDSQQRDFKRHQRERAERFLEEENDTLYERLPGSNENRIDKPLRFENTEIIRCRIEAPGVKIIHGGVLAMRSIFIKNIFAKDAAFSDTNLAQRQISLFPPQNNLVFTAPQRLHPFNDVIETQTRNVFHTLNEKDRRRFAAIQARQLGHGGITYISKLLTLSESTISRGIDELDTLPSDPAEGRVRKPGAGRKKR